MLVSRGKEEVVSKVVYDRGCIVVGFIFLSLLMHCLCTGLCVSFGVVVASCEIVRDFQRMCFFGFLLQIAM